MSLLICVQEKKGVNKYLITRLHEYPLKANPIRHHTHDSVSIPENHLEFGFLESA